jgi:hypothetical protein
MDSSFTKSRMQTAKLAPLNFVNESLTDCWADTFDPVKKLDEDQVAPYPTGLQSGISSRNLRKRTTSQIAKCAAQKRRESRLAMAACSVMACLSVLIHVLRGTTQYFTINRCL